MSNHDLELLVAGFLAAVYGVIALFFLRFWRETRDRLFAFFTAAFVLLLVQRVLLAMTARDSDTLGVYLIRLLAFVLIIVAVIDKNRSAPPTRRD